MEGTVWNALLKGGWTEKRVEETKIFKAGQAGSRGGCNKKGGWNSLTNYDSVFAIFRAESLVSEKPYVQWKGLTQQKLRKKKHTDQESKNKEMI